MYNYKCANTRIGTYFKDMKGINYLLLNLELFLGKQCKSEKSAPTSNEPSLFKGSSGTKHIQTLCAIGRSL